MAIDARIALAGQPLDVMSAISAGQAVGERLKTQGVREQLLNQQAKTGAFDLATKQGQYAYRLAQNLKGQPYDKRVSIMAQQAPYFEELGLDPSSVVGIDLSDQGLDSIIAKNEPFMQAGTSTSPSAVREHQYFQSVINDPNSTEEQKRAARIELKLEAPAKDYAPKLVEVGGVKYMQVGGELFDPVTYKPANGVDGQPVPVEPDAPVQPPTTTEPVTTLTPEEQIRQEADKAAEIVRAEALARQEAGQLDPEAVEKKTKAVNLTKKTFDVVGSILSDDRLGAVTGVTGKLPTFFPSTRDLLNDVQQLSSLLTQENLGIMTGVLSETDIKIIKGIADNLGIIADEKGNVTGISGSYEETRVKLKELQREITTRLNEKDVYIQGQTAVDSSGRKITYTIDGWVNQDGVLIQ